MNGHDVSNESVVVPDGRRERNGASGDWYHAADANAAARTIPSSSYVTDPAPVRSAPPRLYVSGATFRPREGLMLALARAYHLDVWGSTLIGKRAGEQLEVAAELV